MNTETAEQIIKRIAVELRALFPCDHNIELKTAIGVPPRVVIVGAFTYAEGTELLRQHHLGVRHKEVYDAGFNWTKISANLGEVTIEAWADGLPPTCRIIKEKVKIPKTQTVDTGDFIEIEKTRVVCGDTELAALQAQEKTV